MKNKLIVFVAISAVTILSYGCSKKYTDGVNNAVGMTNSRGWYDTSYGYAYGDTLEGDRHFEWPEGYGRFNPDTTFAIQNIDGFTIRVGNTTLAWKVTDSSAGTVTFDSVITGSLNASVVFYFRLDSIVINYHAVYGYNDTAHQYYQTTALLHTN
jgi:hypothetical protein